ncbi:MAG: hypothetical protein ACUVXI_06730 [bacterium]
MRIPRSGLSIVARFAVVLSCGLTLVSLSLLAVEPKTPIKDLKDKFPEGCLSCHKADTENSLTEKLKKIEKHPKIKADDVNVCFKCHKSENAKMNLGSKLHPVHLGSGTFAGYDGSCLSCHFIDGNTQLVSEAGVVNIKGRK